MSDPLSALAIRCSLTRLNGRLGNDVNNALLAIQLHAEVLARRSPDPMVQETVAVIREAVNRAARAVKEIGDEMVTLGDPQALIVDSPDRRPC